MDGKWIVDEKGFIRTPGIDYGPQGLFFIEQVGQCIIARQPGHSYWDGCKNSYEPAHWIVSFIEKGGVIVDNRREIHVLEVDCIPIGRKRSATLEMARTVCKKATEHPKKYVKTYKLREDLDKKYKNSAESVQDARSKAKSPKNNDLALMMDTHKKEGKERQKKIKEYNARIREPDMFFETEHGFGVGYWRVPGGIWKNERYKNGYHYNRGVLIDSAELSLLVDLFDKDAQEICEG